MDKKNQKIYGLLKLVNRTAKKDWQSEIQFYSDIKIQKLEPRNIMQLMWSAEGEKLKIKIKDLSGFKIRNSL